MSFSNEKDDIFALTMPSQVDRGALMSRYSRSKNSMRETYANEFENNPDRGKEFYDKVLAGYGDDSIAELGHAQVACENISNIVAQKMEDRRIGLSFLEKSSRYVPWNEKPYRYYCGEDMQYSGWYDIYKESCEQSFDAYANLIKALGPYMREKYPIEAFEDLEKMDSDKANRIYNNTIRSKILDISRGLLPAGTTTNVAIAGNGRAFEYLIRHLLSEPMEECQVVGGKIFDELETTMGPFISRANDFLPKDYLFELRRLKPVIYDKPDKWPSTNQDTVKLIKCDKEPRAIRHVIAGILLSNTLAPSYTDALWYVDTHIPDKADRLKIIYEAVNIRENRRQKPPRAYEWPTYTFELRCDFGTFRDMHRHRILTLQRGDLSTAHSYREPPEVLLCGMHEAYVAAMEKSHETYKYMVYDRKRLAQYAVNMGFDYAFMVKINLRELCHLIELRSMPQGHYAYRRLVQKMYQAVAKQHPNLVKIIKFVNMDDEDLGRYKSEVKTA